MWSVMEDSVFAVMAPLAATAGRPMPVIKRDPCDEYEAM